MSYFLYDSDMKRLLFFDIDGTLAIGKQVPASAAKALEMVRENGDLVFICTGRNVNYVKANFSAYADGFITNNGRLAYYEDACIYEAPLAKEEVRKIRSIVEDLGAGAVFHTKDHGYYEGPEDLFEPLKIIGDPGYMSPSFKEEEVYYSFDLCYHDVREVDKIVKAFDGFCIVNPHGPHPSADMTVIGSDKGDALKAVRDHFNVKKEDSYAFGDGYNDICMMKAAGHGIAMGNAMKETKEAAEYITTDILKDGVYEAMLHYGLIEGEE